MKLQKASFAAGCFWGVERTFGAVKGVKSTKVGYMGGYTINPTYEQVCSDKTGHAEVVYIEYDPAELDYNELLRVFWDSHNPTTLNRQGLDIGSQYRSIIFYYSEEQKKLAEESLKLEEKRIGKKIVTAIEKAGKFYMAEDYHQKYLDKNSVLKRIQNIFHKSD